MSILSELRTELADMLTAGGVDSYDHIPPVIDPPVAVVAAGDPYIQEVFDAKTFNHDYMVRMEVTLIAAQADNDDVTDALDDLIESTILALGDAWEIDISQPFQLETNGVIFLAARATITTSITIK